MNNPAKFHVCKFSSFRGVETYSHALTNGYTITLISIWIAWNKLPYRQIPGSNFAFADMPYIIDIYRYKHKLKMNIYLQSLHKKAKPLRTVSPKDSSDGNNLLYISDRVSLTLLAQSSITTKVRAIRI